MTSDPNGKDKTAVFHAIEDAAGDAAVQPDRALAAIETAAANDPPAPPAIDLDKYDVDALLHQIQAYKARKSGMPRK